MPLTHAQLNLLIGHQVLVKGEPETEWDKVQGDWILAQVMNQEGLLGLVRGPSHERQEYREIYYSQVQFCVRPLSSITSEELQQLLDLTGGNKRQVTSVNGFGGFKEIPVLHYSYKQPDCIWYLHGNVQFHYMSLNQYLYLFERRLDVLNLISQGYGNKI